MQATLLVVHANIRNPPLSHFTPPALTTIKQAVPLIE